MKKSKFLIRETCTPESKATLYGLLVAFLMIVLPLKAEIKLPCFFGDNMVLQQQMQVPVWGKASPGSQIIVRTGWDRYNYMAKADEYGRWKVRIQTPAAGGPYVLMISEGNGNPLTLGNVFIGEVWLLGGQSNMEMPLQGYRDQPVNGSAREILTSDRYQIHWFKVHRHSTTNPLDTVRQASWKKAAPDNAGEISATGWFFARMLSEQLNVPVGLIACNYGGSTVEAWMSPDVLLNDGRYTIPAPGDTIPVVNRTPTTLYNGMLHPIIGYGIRGCLWYQGESNYMQPERYAHLFSTMVNNWRQLWGQGSFPFYYAQIAPFDYGILQEKGYVNSAFLRDAQRLAEDSIANSGMIVLLDAGDSLCIHPRDKSIVGERFAMLALSRTYAEKIPGMASPRYRSLEIKGNEAVLTFDEASLGLSSFGQPLTGFEVAGTDSLFYPAKARIDRARVIVTAEAVQEPVAVRYGFRDFIVGKLKGTNGLPVSSFRTDDWYVLDK